MLLFTAAEKDTKMGTGSQWERFDFNKDAPLDDKEVEGKTNTLCRLQSLGTQGRHQHVGSASVGQVPRIIIDTKSSVLHTVC